MQTVTRRTLPENPAPGSKVRALLGLLAVEAVFLGILTQFSDLAVAGNPLRFVGLLILGGVAYLWALQVYEHVPSALRPRFFWGASIILRLVVFAMVPGDDIWRYIWEGRVTIAGFNPYLLAPDSPELVSLRDAGWAAINHPEWAAIYPPGAQLLFSWLARISAGPLPFRIAFALADLLTLYMLVRLNTGSGRFRASAWYAWNPAVICFLAGAAHFDSVMILAMTASMWALHRGNPMGRNEHSWMWATLSAVFLGLAISVKVIPIFLLPVWAFALRRRSPVLLISLVIPWLFSLRFGGLSVVLEPLRRFANVTRYNDLVWWMVEGVIPNPAQQNFRYTVILIAVVCVLAVVFRKDWRRAALWVLGACLILSPVLHPWYVCWILPLAAWRRCHPWFFLALSAPVALLVWENGPFWSAWVVTWPIHLAVILPPLLALGWTLWKQRMPNEPGSV